MSTPAWQLFVDTGGTFTDCLARDPAGLLHRVKVLSSSCVRGRVLRSETARRIQVELPFELPAGFFRGYRFRLLGSPGDDAPVADSSGRSIELGRPLDAGVLAGAACEWVSCEEAPVLAARVLTGRRLDQALPEIAMRLATTRGTNALLERRGAPTALFVTRGHRDLIEIGTQTRPELFALQVLKPRPLYRSVVEVAERLDAAGRVLEPLALDPLEAPVAALLEQGIRCGAVALLHSYRNPEHEDRLARFLLERGFEFVASSAELAPLIRILPRAQTAVVDAYLAPVIGRYLQAVGRSVPKELLHLMTSAGGLVRADAFRAKDSLLSGPAGGVVGAAAAGRSAGFERVLGFDMGGTSTDVARYDGGYEYTFEHHVGDASILAPALAIETVAAGGGSICWFDGDRLRVGPESAGADPGPACYGAGGPLALTDVNLLLGRIDPEGFEIPIDVRAAEAAFAALLLQLEVEDTRHREAVLEGFLKIANERMGDAIRRVSLQRGYDPRDYVLVSFGGAGAQHACAVAEEIGVSRVLVPELASLLSAHGLAVAVVERFAHRQVLAPLSGYLLGGALEELLAELEALARSAVAAEGIAPERIEVRRRILALRLAGQESTLELEWRPAVALDQEFLESYERAYGYRPFERGVELESVRVVACSQPGELEPRWPALAVAAPSGKQRSRRAFFAGGWCEVPVLERHRLELAGPLAGPALLIEPHSIVVIEPGWELRRLAGGGLLLERS